MGYVKQQSTCSDVQCNRYSSTCYSNNSSQFQYSNNDVDGPDTRCTYFSNFRLERDNNYHVYCRKSKSSQKQLSYKGSIKNEFISISLTSIVVCERKRSKFHHR